MCSSSKCPVKQRLIKDFYKIFSNGGFPNDIWRRTIVLLLNKHWQQKASNVSLNTVILYENFDWQ